MRRKPARYFGTIELDPVRATVQFAKLVGEVGEQFSIVPGVTVRI